MSRYRIIVTGECARLLAGAIEGIEFELSQAGQTCVVVSVRDEPEFYELFNLFQDFALHIVSVKEVS